MSRPLKGAGIALAGAVLIAGFIVAGFPYARLGEYIEAEVQQATGVALAIGTLEPRLGFAGLGLQASDLSLRWPEGELLALDHRTPAPGVVALVAARGARDPRPPDGPAGRGRRHLHPQWVRRVER